MTKQIVIDLKEYGLQEKKAKDIKALYLPMIGKLEEFEDQFNEIVSQEMSKELISKAKRLRLDISQVRITADKARKGAKEEYLRANKAIQGAYNTLEYAVKSKEDKLLQIEQHFENLEKERIAKLQTERENELTKYDVLVFPSDLGGMDIEVWNNFLTGTRVNYEEKKEAEKKAEAERIAKEKADAEERKRIAKENEQLKKEAIERERLAKIEVKKREAQQQKERETYEAKLKAEREERERIEREEKEKREKLEAELLAKQKEEERQKREAEEKLQAELNKGDAAKVKDLISDLEALKTKYSFKSVKNKHKYKQVGQLLDKVINHINQ